MSRPSLAAAGFGTFDTGDDPETSSEFAGWVLLVVRALAAVVVYTVVWTLNY